MRKKDLSGILAGIILVAGLTGLQVKREHDKRTVAQNYPACDTIAVGKGQNWSGIAKKICPEGSHANYVGKEMRKLNPDVEDIHMLYPGQKIIIPKYGKR